MRKIVVFALLISVVLASASFAASAKNIVIEVGHAYQVTEAVHRALLKGNEILQKQTDGRISLKIYPYLSYGSNENMKMAVRMGVLDVSHEPVGGDEYTLGGVLNAGYLFRDYDHFVQFKNSDTCRRMLDESGKAKGMKYLGMYQFGFRHATTSKVPVTTPKDFKGLKLRVLNVVPYNEFAHILGAVGSPIPMADVYMALKTGVADGQENPFSLIYTRKLYEVQKYLILTGHSISCGGFTMSQKRWDSLSKEDQDIIMDVFAQISDFIDEITIEEEANLLEKLKTAGMIVVNPDKESFMDRAQEVVRDKHPDWLELYDEIRAIK